MDYNVTALVQEVKDKAKDPSLTDSLIITWLQDTQNDVLGHYRLPFLESTETATLTIGDLTYAYPTDEQVIIRVRLLDGQNVIKPDYLTDAEFDDCHPNPDDMPQGQPSAYTDYGRLLYWSVPLDKAYTLKLKYLRTPVVLSSGSVIPDIPVEYKQLLIRGAMAGVEEHRENFDIAALHTRKVEDIAEDMLGRYALRQLQTPHTATLGGKRMGHIRTRH